jgi:predicted  nucleic acid-binding Zn-ribbon protein
VPRKDRPATMVCPECKHSFRSNRKTWHSCPQCGTTIFDFEKQEIPTDPARPQKTTSTAYPKRWSIQQCLITLGASVSEVYHPSRTKGISYKPPEHNSVSGVRKRSLYDVYSAGELKYWVENLYAKGMRKWHPDVHLADKEFYEEKCKQLSEARRRALKILRHRGA